MTHREGILVVKTEICRGLRDKDNGRPILLVAQKIQYSADKTIFIFFKEAMFYKCYYEDEMIFSKIVNAIVISLGFPVSALEKGNLKLLSISKNIGAECYNEENPMGCNPDWTFCAIWPIPASGGLLFLCS